MLSVDNQYFNYFSLSIGKTAKNSKHLNLKIIGFFFFMEIFSTCNPHSQSQEK